MLPRSILAQITMKIFFSSFLLFICSDAFAAESQAAAGKGIFGGTFADALWTVLAFFVLFLVLAKFAWKPVLKNLAAREEHIKHQIQVAQEAREEAERILQEHRHQAYQIIKDASDQALVRAQQLLEKAKQDAADVKHKSEEDIENALSIFSQRIWQQSSDIVLGVSSKILEKSITKEDNQKLINEAIEQLRQETSK